MRGEVVILGGGIGGLTMANALQRVGIPVRLFEQAPELTEDGAGIGISHGALQILDMLGLGEEARRRGMPVRSICLADRQLRIRRRLPANYSGLCIHRPHLIDILKQRLPSGKFTCPAVRRQCTVRWIMRPSSSPTAAPAPPAA